MKTKPDLNKPGTDVVKDIQLSDIFDIDEIQHLQDLFSDAMGVASIITHPDGTPITKPSNFCRLCNDIIRNTERGRANCYQSDAILGRMSTSGAIVQPCLSGGLWDAGAGIAVGGKNIANWLIGQVRNEELDEQRMIRYADEIGANKEEFMAALREVPMMSLDQFKKVSNMLFAFANELSQKVYNNFQLKMQNAAHEDALNALRESEEFNRQIMQNANEGIWMVDMNENTTYINSKMADMLGYTVEEMTGMNVSDFLIPEDIQDHRDKTFQRMAGNPGHYERRIKQKNGEEIWTIVSSSSIIDKTGVYSGSLGMFQDITERKQAEEKIKKIGLHYQAIIEKAPDGIVLINNDGAFIYVSPAAAKMFGLSVEEAISRHPNDYTHPDDLPMVLGELFKLLEDPSYTPTLQYRFADNTGNWKWIESTMSNLLADPNVEAIVINFRDISDRKQSEKELRELNNELDTRVQQRTTELEAAIKELETFSYSVSHDLKAPLRHINGFLEIFLEKTSANFTEEELGYLKNISRSASEMGLLIDAILSFSRLNQAELRKTRIQSSVMVRQVINFFEPEIQNRQITFHVEPLHDVQGDEGLIRQVWTNLISNAIKYTGKKSEAIIEIGSFSTPTETAFFVKDNGAGFNMKYVHKLFGVFQRLHKSREFDGIGIGLANVNRIVKRHGGHCRAEGEQDKGATFHFSIPD